MDSWFLPEKRKRDFNEDWDPIKGIGMAENI